MSTVIAAIHRFPVKGLSADPLERVRLSAGEGLPEDRRFAICHGASLFDPRAPAWQPKRQFLMLALNERLAALRSRFDPATGLLEISRGGKPVARGVITTPLGRDLIAQFFAAYMGAEARGMPRVVEAPGHMFSDHKRKLVSIIGRASITDLERVVHAPVDPRRFRANLLIDGAAPWAELGWVGRDIRIGTVRLRVTERIERCAATNVNPESARRDLNIPKALMDGYGHAHCGVLAEVVDGGDIAIGDPLSLS